MLVKSQWYFFMLLQEKKFKINAIYKIIKKNQILKNKSTKKCGRPLQ